MQKQKQKRWSNSLIESVNLSAGALLIFSVSFQFDHVPLVGNEKSHAIMVDVFAFALWLPEEGSVA